MGQTRSESKDKRKSEVGGACHAVTVAVDHDEIIRARAADCELRARWAEAATAAGVTHHLVSRRRRSAGFGAAANLQRDKVNPCPNLVTSRLIFFGDDLHSERYLTPKAYVTDSRGGRGLL